MRCHTDFAPSVRTLGVAGALCIAMAAGGLTAQPSQYRLIDLGPIGFTPNPEDWGTFGINNRGWAVWFSYDSGFYTAHVYRANEALPQDRIVDIAALIPATPAENVARDINDCGLVVGQSDSDLPVHDSGSLRGENGEPRRPRRGLERVEGSARRGGPHFRSNEPAAGTRRLAKHRAMSAQDCRRAPAAGTRRLADLRPPASDRPP
jgi:hypothetical protein